MFGTIDIEMSMIMYCYEMDAFSTMEAMTEIHSGKSSRMTLDLSQ